jgi:hypothetical protein
MGSASKIILVGATSLIVGIYAVSLKKVQANDISTSMLDVKRVQFEHVQAAAVRTAIDKFLSNPYLGKNNLSSSRTQLGGDATFTFEFKSTRPDTSSDLSMTVYQRTQLKEYQRNQLVVRDTLVPRTIVARVENTALGISYGYVKQGPRKMHRAKWEVTQYYVQREH